MDKKRINGIRVRLDYKDKPMMGRKPACNWIYPENTISGTKNSTTRLTRFSTEEIEKLIQDNELKLNDIIVVNADTISEYQGTILAFNIEFVLKK